MGTLMLEATAGVAVAASFTARLGGFLRKPPVDNSGLVGDFEDVRDGGAGISLCVGDVSREGAAGGCNMNSGDGETVRLGGGFSTGSFAVCVFLLADLGNGGLGAVVVSAWTSTASRTRLRAFDTLVGATFWTTGLIAVALRGTLGGWLSSADEEGTCSC